MRALNSIDSDIEKNAEQQRHIQSELDLRKTDLSKVQHQFSRLILDGIEDGKKSEIKTRLSELHDEVAAYQGSLAILQEGAGQLEAEKTTRLLYDADAVRYSKNLEDAVLLSKSIRERAASLQKQANELVTDITGLFSSVQNGCSHLGTVAVKLPADIAMEPFLTGEMIPTEGENRPVLMNGAGERFQGIVGSLKFEPERESLEMLRETFERLESFRRSVIAFQSGYDLIRSPRSLVNFRSRGRKVPGTTRTYYLEDPPEEMPLVQNFE